MLEECGFTAIAVEADWPDAYRVNRYVMGLSKDPTARVALTDFKRFPTWMWRNVDTMQFLDWLRAHNDNVRAPGAKARFLGLDLYSLRASIEAVVAYLDVVDPKEAERARQRCGARHQQLGSRARWRLAVEPNHGREHDLLAEGEALGELLFDARHGRRLVRAPKEASRARA